MLEELGFPSRIHNLIMQCISTPTYTFNINGETFGYVTGKRGLRQDDPLSPLLFTICLEYLSRLLEITQRLPRFRHHPLCKRINLNHLCFADDLILFSKGDVQSVKLLCSAFDNFSKVSGLKMNKLKSSFYCNGIAHDMIERVTSLTGISRGLLPFKYLGVNISPKRLSVKDCNGLVEKLTSRIKGIGFRKLSYAGRIVLIRSVLSTLHCYWARIFILPTTVIRKIEATCRRFLWNGQENGDRMTLISWESICKPRKQGGLEIRDFQKWNLAAIAKYVWWISEKDNLWVKWVHSVYINQGVWRNYEPSSNVSWTWKKICQVKNLVQHFMFHDNGDSKIKDYSLKMGYEWIEGGYEITDLWPWMYNRWITPKHRFFIWLIAHKRLLTGARLQRMNMITTGNCCICDEELENIDHLFSRCRFSRSIFKEIGDWCGIQLPSEECIRWWIRLRVRSANKKKLMGLILAASIYTIWHVRNVAKCDLVVSTPANVIRRIKNDVISRIESLDLNIECMNTRNWIERLKMGRTG